MIDYNNPKSDGRISGMKRLKSPLIFTFALLAIVLSFWGCAEMIGDQNANQPPAVSFVNTPKDASSDSTTSSWVFNMPFSMFGFNPVDSSIFSLYDEPYQLVQFPDLMVWGDTLRVTLVPDSPVVIKYFDGVDTLYYDEGFDYSIIDSTTLIIQVDPNGDMNDTLWQLVDVIELADTMIITGNDTDFYNIDTLIYFADFKLNTPNFYVFSFAPVVNWYGTDPDGFVEYYEYADIDENFAPNAITDPDGYKNLIPPAKWQTTNATFTTIYLLSAAGDTTQHVLYLRCYDNDGAASSIKYRTFFRSNQAPNTPEIKWDEQGDTEYDTLNYVSLDGVKPADPALADYDSLFCLPYVTAIWNGIILRWRGDDPDDRELYTIPLNYQYYLMELDTLGNVIDTLWYFSDSTLSDEQDITIYHLETGWYKFDVWSYDDGFEESPNAAVMYFRCVKPTFEHSILLYDETLPGPGLGELPNNTLIDSFYLDMLERLDPELAATGYGYDYVDPFDDSTGTQDVLYWDNSTGNENGLVPVILLSKYRMVIFYAEDHKLSPVGYNYSIARDQAFSRYLDAGGRLWINGRCLMFGSFQESVGVGNSTNQLLNKMQVTQRYTSRVPNNYNQPYEFVGSINAVDFLDTLSLNMAYLDSLSLPFPEPDITGGFPEIDWISRDEDATTLYYFKSITGELSEVPRDTFALVLDWTNQPPYPAPNGFQCWLSVPDENVTEVSYVFNVDKNQGAEIISVTTNDEIFISYEFQPDTVYNENSEVLNAGSVGGNYSDPTYTACFIRTDRYDQVFLEIYNITRNSYAEAVSISQFDVQVNYSDVSVTIEPGHFDYVEPPVTNATDTSCTITVEKNFIDVVQEIRNVSQNWDGYLIERDNNILTVGYAARPGFQWLDSDSIVVKYTYHQYWEVGDQLSVDYATDRYWEKGDIVEVHYSYNPVTEAHLKPCAIRYEYYQIYNFTFTNLFYRTAVFTFPFYFMENDTMPGATMGKVDKVFYEMIDWFLDPEVHLDE